MPRGKKIFGKPCTRQNHDPFQSLLSSASNVSVFSDENYTVPVYHSAIVNPTISIHPSNRLRLSPVIFSLRLAVHLQG